MEKRGFLKMAKEKLWIFLKNSKNILKSVAETQGAKGIASQ